MIDKKREPLINIFMEWNDKINLSSFNDAEQIYTKHILDSIELNKSIKLPD
jgi:16S rRNA G527 N7-methylase RsmG